MSGSSSIVGAMPVAVGFASPGQFHFSDSSHFTVTPSPFAQSLTNTSWSSRLAVIRHSKLLLHAVTFLFSFASAISLAAPRPHGSGKGQAPFNFMLRPEFRYSIGVAIVALVYATVQLFKGICDMAFNGLIIPDMVSDYVTFVFDQVMAYLLLSSSSISLLATIQVAPTTFKTAAIISTGFSLSAFVAFAACALLSGYKLCKRIIW